MGDEGLTKEQVLVLIVKSLPQSHLISNIDMSENRAVRFTWFGTRFRVTNSLFTEVVDGGILESGPTSTLMGALLEKVYFITPEDEL